jgi:hypothetical protein
MRVRSGIVVLAAVAGLLLSDAAGAAKPTDADGARVPPKAASAASAGSYEQVSWVRRAASNFVNDELRGDGAGACSILNAPLRATQHHRTCAQRWDSRLASLRRRPGARAQLRTDAKAIPSATVRVRGNTASIELPAPLIGGPNRFLWTENCWMLEG